MRVALATLCESVNARDDGRIDVIGAAPDRVAVDGFPWRGRLTLALILQLDGETDPGQTGMNVSVVSAADGSVVGTVDPDSAKQPRKVPTNVGGPVHMPFELGLQVAFPQAGSYAVLVRDPSGEELARVDVGVMPRD